MFGWIADQKLATSPQVDDMDHADSQVFHVGKRFFDVSEVSCEAMTLRTQKTGNVQRENKKKDFTVLRPTGTETVDFNNNIKNRFT